MYNKIVKDFCSYVALFYMYLEKETHHACIIYISTSSCDSCFVNFVHLKTSFGTVLA